jgi:hypothetical protein
MVDDFCQCLLPKRKPGPQAPLSESEVVTLALFARWSRFSSERDFYRYATSRLHDAFPTLPDRSQFNRLVHHHLDLIEAVALHLVELMEAQECSYEALDTSAMPVRDAKRRGGGWLAGLSDIGWSNSLGWYEGFRLLVAINPVGVITGFGFAAASTKDQPLAETFFALRAEPNERLPSVGSAALGPYVAETKASKAKKTIGGGSISMERASSARQYAMDAAEVGQSGCDAGLHPSVRLWRLSTRSCTTPSAFAESALTTSLGCGYDWRQG